MISFENVTIDAASGYFRRILQLPKGFTAPLVLRENIPNSSNTNQVAVFTDGRISLHPISGYTYRRVITYLTADSWPTDFPGSAY